MGEEEAPWARDGNDRSRQLDDEGWAELGLADDGLALFGEGAWLTVAPGVQLRSGEAGSLLGTDDPVPQLGSVRRASGDAAGASQTSSPGGEETGAAQEAAAIRSRTPHRPRAASAFGRVMRVAAACAAVLVAIVVMLAVKSVGQSTSAQRATSAGPTSAPQAPGEGAPASGSTPTPTPISAPTPAPTSAPMPSTGIPAATSDWWPVLGELDRRRGAALAAADVEAVSGYAAADSAYRDSEIRLLERVKNQSLSPRGWATTLVAVESVRELAGGPTGEPAPTSSSGPAAVRLTVVDRRSRYDLVDPSGAVVRTVAASGKRRWQLTLIRGSAVAPAGSAEGADAQAHEDARSAVADDVDGGPTAGVTTAPGAAVADRSAGWRIAEVEASKP